MTACNAAVVLFVNSTVYSAIIERAQNISSTAITLNLQKALNALGTPLIPELDQALDDAGANDEIAAVVLTGSKRTFAGKSICPSCNAYSI